MPSNSAVKPDGDRVSYAAPQVPFMQPDMVHSGVLSDWLEDDRMWVPQTANTSICSSTPRITMASYAVSKPVGSEIRPTPTAHEAEAIVTMRALNFSNVATQRHSRLGSHLTKRFT